MACSNFGGFFAAHQTGKFPEGDPETPASPSSDPGMSEIEQFLNIVLVILVVGIVFLKICFASPSVDPVVGFWDALTALQVTLCFFHRDHNQATAAETTFACIGVEMS